VPTGVVSQEVHDRTVADFLTTAPGGPSALVVEGEPGIGKTTLWLAAVEEAAKRGFRVLTTRPGAAQSVPAYTALAELLGGVDEVALARLPDPQRAAIDGVLSRTNGAGMPADPRAVAAAFLAIVEGLAAESPVLIGLDDVQWLDPSSVGVLGFALRRLSGPLAVVGAVRTGPERVDVSWLQLPEPHRTERIMLGPMAIGALHAVLHERLGVSLPRPAMVHIHEVSNGNPFYALELARAIGHGESSIDATLPPTLAELVRTRVGGVEADVGQVLLAAACASSPTVELLARAVDADPKTVVALLEEAESQGIIELRRNRVSFAHPLLARGIYTDAGGARRTAMHRRLADVVEEPEPAARHLALASDVGDPATLARLDAAADMARMRGAPAAAAELIELAIGLGGDTPERRIRSASDHFDAGDPRRARAALEKAIAAVKSGPLLALALFLLALVRISDDSFLDAAGLLERGLGDAADDLALRVQMLVTLTFAWGNAGRFAAAADTIEAAVADAEQLGRPSLLSHALGMRVMVHFIGGGGVDETSLRRALELEDPDAAVPLFLRPSLHNALLLAYTGELEKAHDELIAIRRGCVERGEENELSFLAFYHGLVEMWRGDFTAAAAIARDAEERAGLLGGDLPRFGALTLRAGLAAYAGDLEAARRDCAEALAASERSSSTVLAEWTVTFLAFAEVSHANYAAAIDVLQPQIARLDQAPDGTEIVAAGFVPDAVEALIQLGRLDAAQTLVERLDRNGRRLDRPWMLAVSSRGRAMLCAARGDLAGAASAAAAAMAQHDRLPMPFERARTALLLGEIQRRQRRKEAAAHTLHDALASFEALGVPLWAEKARAELDRCVVVARRPGGLTAGERKVAELAASGMTNRNVAEALFMSPKTVEANLARVYRNSASAPGPSWAATWDRPNNQNNRETPDSAGIERAYRFGDERPGVGSALLSGRVVSAGDQRGHPGWPGHPARRAGERDLRGWRTRTAFGGASGAR
jgi:tetratricopeptide (TPR) repeat protein